MCNFGIRKMIKRIFFNLFWNLVQWSSCLYSHKTSEKIRVFNVILYSAWISNEFKSFGKGSRIISFSCLLGGKYITIGENCYIGRNTVLTAWARHGSDIFSPQIIIGNNVQIGDDSHITATNRIDIGNNVLAGKKITITDNAHGRSDYEALSIPPSLRSLYSPGPVIIEEGVWIGDKVTILPNVRIGKNAIIGANAVVTKDIPDNCVVGGIPAKVIKIMK